MSSNFVKSGVLIEKEGQLREQEYEQSQQQYKTNGNAPQQPKASEIEKTEFQNFQKKLLNNEHIRQDLYNEDDFDYFQYYGQLQEEDNKMQRMGEQEIQKQNLVRTIQQQENVDILVDREVKSKLKRKLVTLVKSTSQASNQENKRKESEEEQEGETDQYEKIQKIQKTESLINYNDSSDEEKNNDNEGILDLKKSASNTGNNNLQIPQSKLEKLKQEILDKQQKQQEEKQLQKAQSNKLALLDYGSDSD